MQFSTTNRSKGVLFVACVLLVVLSPLPATIQVGFPVISRSGNTAGYANFTGSLTGTGNPCLDGSGNLTVSGCTGTLAAADLTGQTAAKTSTLLFTPTATGMYRISYYAKVTTPGSTSILGGTSGLVLTYTDGTDSVAQTAFTLPEFNQAGAALSIGTGNVTNTTQAVNHGEAVIFALTGVPINYAYGYTSTGTAMQYELHVRISNP